MILRRIAQGAYRFRRRRHLAEFAV